MSHIMPPDTADRFAVLIMRPEARDRYGVNRPGIHPLKSALESLGVSSAVLDCSHDGAPGQLLRWLQSGQVSFVYAQGGWGAQIMARQGNVVRSIFDQFETPFFARIAVPPFAASAIDAMSNPIAGKTILLGDKDAVSFAQTMPGVAGPVLPFSSVFAGFAGGTRRVMAKESPSSRSAALVVAGMDPVDKVRERWHEAFPEFAVFLDSLAERAYAERERHFTDVVRDSLEAECVNIWEAGTKAFSMLTLVNMHVTSRLKLAMIRQAAAYPFRFILDGDLTGIRFHRDAEVSGPVPAGQLGEAYASCAAAISCNPNNMSGAISERIPAALNAGAAVVHARNSLLSAEFRAGEDFLEFEQTNEDMARVFSAVADGGGLAEMNSVMQPRFMDRFGPDRMAARLLELVAQQDGLTGQEPVR